MCSGAPAHRQRFIDVSLQVDPGAQHAPMHPRGLCCSAGPRQCPLWLRRPLQPVWCSRISSLLATSPSSRTWTRTPGTGWPGGGWEGRHEGLAWQADGRHQLSPLLSLPALPALPSSPHTLCAHSVGCMPGASLCPLQSSMPSPTHASCSPMPQPVWPAHRVMGGTAQPAHAQHPQRGVQVHRCEPPAQGPHHGEKEGGVGGCQGGPSHELLRAHHCACVGAPGSMMEGWVPGKAHGKTWDTRKAMHGKHMR